MTIPNVYLLQGTRRNLELAKAFQEGMGANFFKHTMYDVKDALSSILALCDLAEMKELPSVKENIQKVTQLISDVSLYHDHMAFNVEHVVVNVIKILQGSYKESLNISLEVSLKEALARGSQGHLEKSLLYLIIEAIESIKRASGNTKKDVQLMIELSQKNRDAIVTIRVQGFHFEEVIRKEILSFGNQNELKVQVFEINKDTEVTMKVPLSFPAPDADSAISEEALSISIDELKRKKAPTLKKELEEQSRVRLRA